MIKNIIIIKDIVKNEFDKAYKLELILLNYGRTINAKAKGIGIASCEV